MPSLVTYHCGRPFTTAVLRRSPLLRRDSWARPLRQLKMTTAAADGTVAVAEIRHCHTSGSSSNRSALLVAWRPSLQYQMGRTTGRYLPQPVIGTWDTREGLLSRRDPTWTTAGDWTFSRRGGGWAVGVGWWMVGARRWGSERLVVDDREQVGGP